MRKKKHKKKIKNKKKNKKHLLAFHQFGRSETDISFYVSEYPEKRPTECVFRLKTILMNHVEINLQKHQNIVLVYTAEQLKDMWHALHIRQLEKNTNKLDKTMMHVHPHDAKLSERQ